MSKLPLVLALLCVAGTSATLEWTNLMLKFAILDGYYSTPLTLTEFLAADSKYTFMATDSELNVDFYSYANDPRIAIGFDSYGSIAGVRVGFIKSDLATRATENGLVFNYTYADKPLYTSGTYWDTEVYYSTILFASPETLAAGGRSAPGGLVADDVYLPLGGEYTLIPSYECNATNIGFTKQGCFDGMGIHYILNMSTSMACEDHQGPFLLYESGTLVGLGFFPFGTFSSTTERTWFEDPPSYLTSTFAPDAPTCFSTWASNYGVTSFHIFFKAHPRWTICVLGANKSVC